MPSRSSGRVVLDGLEALDVLESLDTLDALDALDTLDTLEFYFLGGDSAVDVDTHEVDAPGHVADVEAVATNGLDGAAASVNQFHALHPGVGTHDDVVAGHAYIHIGQARLVDAAGGPLEHVVEADRARRAHRFIAARESESDELIVLVAQILNRHSHVSPTMEIDVS